MVYCKKCGFTLEDDQDFCPKCGTPKNEQKNKICGKCGFELQEGQDFCPKCGQKAGLDVDPRIHSSIDQIGSSGTEENKRLKPKYVKAIVATVIVLVLVGVGIFLMPKIFVSVEDLCAQGNYVKAYEKAENSNEKMRVKAESIVAFQSAISADNLKDPSSFKLRDAYYEEDTNSEGDPTGRLVLYISGANSYGASVSNYWLYSWNNENNKWEYRSSFADLSQEEISDYDSYDEVMEKMSNNWDRIMIQETMIEGMKLDKETIKRINDLYENDKLDSVMAIKLSRAD